MVLKFKKTRDLLLILIKTLRLLWRTSPPKLILIIIIDTLSGAIIPIGLWVWKEFIDAVTNILIKDGSIKDSLIYLWLALHFVLILLNSITLTLSNYIQNIYSSMLNKVISKNILEKVSLLDLKDFDNANIYNQIQKSNDESLTRSISLLRTLVGFIKNLTSFVGIVGILLYFNTGIVLLCVLSALPMFYISLKILNKWFEVFNMRFENNRFVRHLKTLAITNQNIKELKIYNANSFLLKTIMNILDDYLKEDKKIRRRFLIETSIVEIIDKGIVYFIKILVVLISVKSKLSIGSLTMYLTSVDNLKDSISNLLSLVSTAYEDCLYVQNIFVLLDLPVQNQNDKPDFPSDFHCIQFRNVSFIYPGTDQYVLKNLNLSLYSPQSYVVVGQNGSGKTTLIKLLLNLYQPTEGEILVDGVNINAFNQSTLFANISAVFQDFIKYPFDVKTNIGLGDLDHLSDLDQIKTAAEQSGASQFITKLPSGYDTKLQKEWSGSVDLSLGQWQKLAITRALMKPAPILVLDEPTASLDAIAEYEIYQNFRGMREDRLCIMVSHRFVNTLFADSIIVLQAGELVEMGSHRDLMIRNGIYANLYKLQAESYEKVPS
ncbi:ABC transporter ATP-binding protein [Paenibacillus sp. J22TS3]|uniref:ABC transporter ATP-binding protein n=1 Tax=Paenibacillus sp. J22TS3 TaxID=2807192 RepID=UPI001B0DD4F5|nr:ABC transporter ATP-binding protein [Paenibacillus sp. J22TS3]GIP21126.1 ABC transporter ATP-binding protein [Paenibacillus sp. J22TS3]